MRIRPQPTPKNPEGFYAAFNDIKEQYESAGVTDQISKAAEETCLWLESNKGGYLANGALTLTSWFDEKAFASEPLHDMAVRARFDLLRAKIHEHGIAKLFSCLYEDEFIDIGLADEKTDDLVFLRSGELKGWLRNLVPYSWKDQTMNLQEFKDTGDFGVNTTPSHSRKKLYTGATLGMFTVYSTSPSYVIAAGPIAKAFYELVLDPVLITYESKINRGGKKWKEAA